MPGPVFATVLSGFSVSSAVYLSPTGPWAVSVPSMAGNQVRIDFTTVSGGAGDTSFGALHMVPTEASVIASSAVRPAWGLVQAVTPWARVHFGGNVTDTTSVVFHVVR